MAKKGKDIGPDLFSEPTEPKVSNFSVAKKIQEIISDNHGGLIITDDGVDEFESRKILGEKFDQIIIGVCNDDQAYQEYFPLKDTILSFLQWKFPSTPSCLLVFETIYHNTHAEKKIPVCFDAYGKLDLVKTYDTFKPEGIEDFLKRITPGDPDIQKYTIWENDLKSCLLAKPEINKVNITKNKLRQEKQTMDDNFPIPKAVPGLPYIHLENKTFALDFMIGLYTRYKIEEVLKKISDTTPPYDTPWLKPMADKLLKDYHEFSYDRLVKKFSRYDDVVKTREWKGRLTMRLKNMLLDRKIANTHYNNGVIFYTPTKVGYEKEILFTFRPNQWRTELLRRAEERKNYAENMEKIQSLLYTISDEGAGVFINTQEEMLKMKKYGGYPPLAISSLIGLDEDQQKLKIQKRIDGVYSFQPADNNEKKIGSLPVDEPSISFDEQTQKIADILDGCNTIEALQQYQKALIELDIIINDEEQEVVDKITGGFISFGQLCEDGPESIKIALLERFHENRDIPGTKPLEHKEEHPSDTEATSDTSVNGFDPDDLPF